MFTEIWHEGLYRPLLNALFLLYDRVAGENMGVAIIELTLLIRVLLLPLSLISERKKALLESLSLRVATIQREFKSDLVKQRTEIRKVMKEHRVNPWAKAIVIAVQVLILILLYQVFVGGLSAVKLDALYPFVRRPDFVDTNFLGFDVAVRNPWWALAVGVLLFIEIAIDQAQRRHLLVRRDVFYRYAFPIASAFVLAKLPMTKSLFILTSMLFSALLFGIRKGVTSH